MAYRLVDDQFLLSSLQLIIRQPLQYSVGRCSSVGIATGYGLDGLEIDSRWRRDFPHLSRPALGPTQPPVQWVPGLSLEGKEWPGRDADPSPPFSTVGHERIELYLYSPYGPYGLYRASVPVQGCTLTLHYNIRRHIFSDIDSVFNPLNPELNPICYLLALLGAHHFLHVSRIRVKLLTFRLLMSCIYMERLFLMFLDHTQRRSTVGRTPLDE